MRRTRITYWNPLTDDGDALRLAVKMHMSIEINDPEYDTDCLTVDVCSSGPYATWQCVSQSDDPYAATRRAIVRAAAEIGRSMK